MNHILLSRLNFGGGVWLDVQGWKVFGRVCVAGLTWCMWLMTSAWQASSRVFPFTSKISSPTSKLSLSAGEPGRERNVESFARLGFTYQYHIV
jgi:hypothetical protein